MGYVYFFYVLPVKYERAPNASDPVTGHIFVQWWVKYWRKLLEGFPMSWLLLVSVNKVPFRAILQLEVYAETQSNL